MLSLSVVFHAFLTVLSLLTFVYAQSSSSTAPLSSSSIAPSTSPRTIPSTSLSVAPSTPPSSGASTSSVTGTGTAPSSSSKASSSSTSKTSKTRPGWTSTSYGASGSTPPDVLLNVPELSVGRIELDVDNLAADINLNANVANLVQVNAGVAVSIRKVNITIADVSANLELIVRLGHLVDIVHRVFESLDLNPLLITAINNVTSILETTVGAVDGLLGSIAHGGTNLSFLIDNLGNIVQQVVGTAGNVVSSIVGDYQTNMTYTGKQQNLGNGLVQKQYSYGPLNALVNIVFNTLGQLVSATVVKQPNDGTGTPGTSPNPPVVAGQQPKGAGQGTAKGPAAPAQGVVNGPAAPAQGVANGPAVPVAGGNIQKPQI